MARGIRSEDKKRPERPDVLVKDALLKHVSDKAFLLIKDGGEHWIPKSQARFDDPKTTVKKKGDKGDMLISGWIAGEKGLGPTQEEFDEKQSEVDDTGDYSE